MRQILFSVASFFSSVQSALSSFPLHNCLKPNSESLASKVSHGRRRLGEFGGYYLGFYVTITIAVISHSNSVSPKDTTLFIQHWSYNLWGPLQNENVGPYVYNLLRILRLHQQSIDGAHTFPSAGPSGTGCRPVRLIPRLFLAAHLSFYCPCLTGLLVLLSSWSFPGLSLFTTAYTRSCTT